MTKLIKQDIKGMKLLSNQLADVSILFAANIKNKSYIFRIVLKRNNWIQGDILELGRNDKKNSKNEEQKEKSIKKNPAYNT